MLLLIDNYDSFTYNLVHFLGELGAPTRVYRNDKVTVDEVLGENPAAIVLSPGPCDPDRAGICLPLIEAAKDVTPLLGVCLGHQAIGQAFGGRVVRAPEPVHGKLTAIHHDDQGLFAGCPNPFLATRYHSLMVAEDSLPPCLEVTARSDDGVIQGLRHRHLPVFGVQFHPESVLTPSGKRLLRNFQQIVADWTAAHGARQLPLC